MEDKIKLLMSEIRKVKDFDRVKFIILFGSYANSRQNKLSDIDFVIYYEGDKKERFKFRLKLLSILPDNFDIQIFQDLPLFIRTKALKGKIVYSKDLGFIYDVAYDTIKKVEDFKQSYYDYINTRKLKI